MHRCLPIALLVPVVLATAPLTAEDSAPVRRPVLAWASAGLGSGNHAFAGAASLDILVHAHVLSLRGAFTADIFDDSFWQVGALYGHAARWAGGVATASAGVALMGADYRPRLGGCRTVSGRLSVPLAAQVGWERVAGGRPRSLFLPERIRRGPVRRRGGFVARRAAALTCAHRQPFPEGRHKVIGPAMPSPSRAPRKGGTTRIRPVDADSDVRVR